MQQKKSIDIISSRGRKAGIARASSVCYVHRRAEPLYFLTRLYPSPADRERERGERTKSNEVMNTGGRLL